MNFCNIVDFFFPILSDFMVFRYPLLLICFLCFQSAVALIPGKYDKLFTVGINFTKPEYSGELGNNIFGFFGEHYGLYWGMGTTFSANMNPSFDVGINSNFGSYGYYKHNNHNFISNKFDMTALVNYKLDNGYILNRENTFSPFLTTGIGFAKYSRNKKLDTKVPYRFDYFQHIDMIIPIGAGVQVKFNKTWGFRYQYLYYLTNYDLHDKRLPSTASAGNDKFGQHLISILYSFGNIVREENCKCDY